MLDFVRFLNVKSTSYLWGKVEYLWRRWKHKLGANEQGTNEPTVFRVSLNMSAATWASLSAFQTCLILLESLAQWGVNRGHFKVELNRSFVSFVIKRKSQSPRGEPDRRGHTLRPGSVGDARLQGAVPPQIPCCASVKHRQLQQHLQTAAQRSETIPCGSFTLVFAAEMIRLFQVSDSTKGRVPTEMVYIPLLWHVSDV